MTETHTVERPVRVQPAGAQATASWFYPFLSVFVVLGVLFRVLYSIIWEWGAPVQGDPAWYHQSAASLEPAVGSVGWAAA